MVSSAPSSQLHSLPLIPEHTHNIERINDTRTCRHGPQTRMTRVHAAVVPCPHHLRHLPPFCVSATPKSFVRRRPLAPLPALALSRASGNDIRDLAAFVVSEVPPARREVCDHHDTSGNGGERCCSGFLGSGSGVAHHDGGPLRLQLSPSSSEPSSSRSILLPFAPSLERSDIVIYYDSQ